VPDGGAGQAGAATEGGSEATPGHLDLARESLRDLVADPRIPPEVRESLAEDYRQVEAMLAKLEQGHIHIAVFGRVSVGKSATLNALLGQRRFSTSPLHGETKATQMGRWQEYESGGVFLIDTPGLNEVQGEERERLAHEVAGRADLVLFVVDGDLTETEIRALRIYEGASEVLELIVGARVLAKEGEKVKVFIISAEMVEDKPRIALSTSSLLAERAMRDNGIHTGHPRRDQVTTDSTWADQKPREPHPVATLSCPHARGVGGGGG